MINSAGLVAGDTTLADGGFRAFLFDSGMRNLGTLGGNESMAFAVNEKGWVTGAAQLTSGPRHAFRYDGSMHDLGSLGGDFAQGQAINESGQVAGWSTLDPAHNDPVHAFFTIAGQLSLEQEPYGWSSRLASRRSVTCA